MKKLFFTALVAVVAVGGAFAETRYKVGEAITYICEGEDRACHLAYSPTPGNTSTSDVEYNGSTPQTSDIQPLDNFLVEN